MESGVSSGEYEAVRAENAQLREQVAQLEERASQAVAMAEGREQRIEELTHELAQLKRLIFGFKSERFEPTANSDQLPLFTGSAVVQPAPVHKQPGTAGASGSKKQKPVRQVLPAHLPREVIVIEPTEDVSAWKKIGEEVSETLDYRAAKLVVIRRVRPKYVDPSSEDGGVRIAELPARPIEKGIAEAGLLAHLLTAKYVDHLPYYRQVQQFKREGITLAESTIGGWGTTTLEMLIPLYERLVDLMRRSGYIQADETPIAVQDRKKKGKTHRGYYWVYLAPSEGLVCMDYQQGRGRDGPSGFLAGFTGALHSDGYVVYDAYDSRDAITTYNCWAHARRHFFEAQDSAPKLAAEALRQIGKLYEIERELRDENASPEARRQVRRRRAAPILKAFKRWLEANGSLPQSPWGKAVSYALTRWDKLTRYTEDGQIEIDTNLVENAIRPIALGRKNYLFAGSHAAAQRAAVVYSLLATCKQHDINPEQWLQDVLARIPTHPHKKIDELLPHIWMKGNR